MISFSFYSIFIMSFKHFSFYDRIWVLLHFYIHKKIFRWFYFYFDFCFWYPPDPIQCSILKKSFKYFSFYDRIWVFLHFYIHQKIFRWFYFYFDFCFWYEKDSVQILVSFNAHWRTVRFWLLAPIPHSMFCYIKLLTPGAKMSNFSKNSSKMM